MFAFCLCKRPVETRKLSFHLHTGCLPWQKLTQKIAKFTCACRQTVAGLLFVFVDHGAGIRSATYLCLDCAKNVDKNWNITLFIIHVNFDHVWAEHYPATLSSPDSSFPHSIFQLKWRRVPSLSTPYHTTGLRCNNLQH